MECMVCRGSGSVVGGGGGLSEPECYECHNCKGTGRLLLPIWIGQVLILLVGGLLYYLIILPLATIAEFLSGIWE